MTKPWEEEWFVYEDTAREPDVYRKLDDEGTRSRVLASDSVDNLPAAKLAASAPAMARLLRDLYNNHGDRHRFDWAYWHSEIEMVLRDAGVEPSAS